MQFTDDKGNIVERIYVKPDDPEKLEKYIKRGGKFLAAGLAKIDRAIESDLVKFAEEKGVDISDAKSIDTKKSLLKSAMLEKIAADMDVDKSVYSDLDTYFTKAGEHLPLSPDTEEKIIRGLELISDPTRFKGDDLKAYARSKDISGRSVLKVEELRVEVIRNYIDEMSKSLTPGEKKKFRPDKLRDKFRVNY